MPPLAIAETLEQLKAAVQRNCHIADARHAGDYTLCVYLLKMREFYRWEQGIDFQTTLTSDDVGDWLTGREGLWDELEDASFAHLPCAHSTHDPFDNAAVNRKVNNHGLVYSAGYGRRCRPLFFLAELEQKIEQDGYTILVSGKELARDLEAPPAMNQGSLVFIRSESLRRMLWEKVEEWRWSELDNPMGRSIACYDFDKDIETALDAMAEAETKMMVAHEIGEIKAGQALGDEQWQQMLFNLPASHADIMLRSIRDHLADCLHTLPTLLENDNKASIHFYFGNLTAMRKKLAPDLLDAYHHWHEHGDTAKIAQWADEKRDYWQTIAQESMELFAENGAEAKDAIEQRVSAYCKV